MFLALFDHVIRFRYGLALWRTLGKPETVFLPLGHYASILTIPILKWKVISFFKKKLGRRLERIESGDTVGEKVVYFGRPIPQD